MRQLHAIPSTILFDTKCFSILEMDEIPDTVVVRENGKCVPILFSVGSNRLVVVSALKLSLRFKLKLDSMHVDEDISDGQSGILTHTIGMLPSSVGVNTT